MSRQIVHCLNCGAFNNEFLDEFSGYYHFSCSKCLVYNTWYDDENLYSFIRYDQEIRYYPILNKTEFYGRFNLNPLITKQGFVPYSKMKKYLNFQ